MKKCFYLLVLSLVFTSCQTEDTNSDSNSLELKADFEFKTLVGSKIATEKNGKIILNVSDERILETFKKFNTTNNLQLEPKSFKVINVDGNNYIRFYNKNNQVSTISLIKGNDNYYTTGSTVCTSTACASGGGCIPNGDYCTKCRPEGTPPGSPDRDCTRTTTGFTYAD
tara:strand:- start:137 stop:643 length:507 start_codon:yes stop_codon:yes gene_type:complete